MPRVPAAGRDPLVWLTSAGLSVLLLAPALGPHVVLVRDMVAVPRMSWLPAWFGLGPTLPRAVPEDAVAATASMLAPGWVWQQLALVGALVLLGVGAARLADPPGRGLRAVVVVLAIWNPWVAERLAQGNLSLLVMLGALPWLLVAARRVRRGEVGAWRALLGWTALGSLVPTAGAISAGLALAVVLGPGARGTRRVAAAAGVVVLQLPWLVPALVHPAAGSSDIAGAGVFGLRSEGSWGVLLTGLGGGGIWNAEALVPSRGWWTSPVMAVLLVVLAAAGWRGLTARTGRAVPAALLLAAVGALAWGLLTAWAPGAAGVVVGWPGGGLLRDAHKWLAPGVLLLALAAPWGLLRLPHAATDAGVRALAATALALLPLIVAPDLAFGLSGRLGGTTIPAGYEAARSALLADERPGDVVVLPWGVYRAFDWNARRASLDPAPRLLPRPSVVDDRLVVARREGGEVIVAGEDPRARAVSEALAAGRPLAPLLAGLGVRYVLVESGTPGAPAPAVLAGLVPLTDGPGAVLLEVPGDLAGPPTPALWRVVVVAGVDLAAVMLLLLAGLAALTAAIRRRSTRAGAALGTVPPPDHIREAS